MCATGAQEGVLGSILSRREKKKNFVSDKEKNKKEACFKRPSRQSTAPGLRAHAVTFSNRSKNH
jgi:hypothetical protein